MYLASCLERDGHHVILEDHRLRPGNVKWIEESLRDFQPDIVGLSACTVEAESMRRIARIAKSLSAVVVCGGPHGNACYQEILADPDVDYVVQGEGEITFPELVEVLGSGGGVDTIRGLVWKQGGEARVNEPREFVPDLDTIPFPAWRGIPLKEYFRASRSGTLKTRRYAPIITSRGCPYGCTYCHRIFGRKIRFRSLDNVFAEMEYLVREHGIEEFQVDDDCFNLDRQRVEEFCDRVVRENLRVRFVFPNGLRGDLLDRDMLIKLKAAGACYIAVAIESASPRLQELIGKHLDLEKVRAAIADCRDLGISTIGFFMFGFPSESRDEARKTMDWAVTSKLDLAVFFYLNPFKGTEVYQQAIQSNPSGKEKLAGGSYGYFGTDINLSDIPDRALKVLFREAYRRFYLRRIPRILLGPVRRNVSLLDGGKSVLARAFRTRG